MVFGLERSNSPRNLWLVGDDAMARGWSLCQATGQVGGSDALRLSEGIRELHRSPRLQPWRQTFFVQLSRLEVPSDPTDDLWMNKGMLGGTLSTALAVLR